ncbi:hypothetical protein [Bacteroides rodentium]
MKTVFLLFAVCCTAVLIFFSSCEDDPAPPIDLADISGVYKGDELRIFLNGEEYSSPDEEVGLALPSMVSGDTKGGDVSSGEKMLLQLLPLWPNFRVYPVVDEFKLILMEVEAVSTTEEVNLRGSYTDASQYVLEVEGCYRDGVLMLNLTYTTNVQDITGNAFVFDFTEEAIDLSQLNPTITSVEYDGEQIPVYDFVRDAMMPVVALISERLGGSLRIEFLPDGSANVGIKKRSGNSFFPIIGKHGYRFHYPNWGYLFSDTEGATWVAEAVEAYQLRNVSPLYGWHARDKYFISVFYGQTRDSDLLLTVESPTMCRFRKFLSPWLDYFGNGNGLSVEETKRCRMVSSMIYNKQIELICLRGIKQC